MSAPPFRLTTRRGKQHSVRVDCRAQRQGRTRTAGLSRSIAQASGVLVEAVNLLADRSELLGDFTKSFPGCPFNQPFAQARASSTTNELSNSAPLPGPFGPFSQIQDGSLQFMPGLFRLS
jgi:hypothetical protein